MGPAPRCRALSQVNPALGLRVVAVHVAAFCLPGASANRPRVLQFAAESPAAAAAGAAPARLGPEQKPQAVVPQRALAAAAERRAGPRAETADVPHPRRAKAAAQVDLKSPIQAFSMTAKGNFVRNSGRRAAKGSHPSSLVAASRAQVVHGLQLAPGGLPEPPPAHVLGSGDPAAFADYGDDGNADGVFVPPPTPNGTALDVALEGLPSDED
ncbi:unnamed protein product, partial [Prorocentrum cordatum]